MKVLHILHELKFSGAEIMYVDAADEFRKLGCELYVINSAKKLGEYAIEFEKAGYKVIHMPYPKGIINRIKYYKSIIRFVKDNNINIIHIHDSGMKWGMALCAKIAGIKSIYTAHNCFYNPPLTRPYQIWLRWSAKHLFGCKFQSISDSVEKNERDLYHNKTTKVYNWYGNKRYFPAREGEKIQIRKHLGISENTLVLISVGGCSEIKRHSEIISQLPSILRLYPNTIYLHLGSGNTLEDEKNLAKKLGIYENIRFEGNKKNVRDYLIASDFYIMPSKFEGIPITTIEALACKIPSILYNVPGLRDFNSNKECSMLIPEQSEEIVLAIKKLTEDKDYRDLISENGYEYVQKNYYLPNNAKKIFDLYQS